MNRSGVGEQITYAGRPLYMFDNGPGMVTGEGYDEPGLPPWHGVWWLMSPSGRALAWPGTLTTTTVGHRTVLATMALTGAGWESFPVYAYSKDSSTSSHCTGSCATAWPPVLTSGGLGVSSQLSPSNVGTLHRSDGTTQMTHKGKPLYFYSLEQIAQKGSGFAATGNGNDIKAGGGTFRLVTP